MAKYSNKRALLVLLGLSIMPSLFAQSTNAWADPNKVEFWMLLMIGVFSLAIIMVLFMLIYLLVALKQVVFKQMGMEKPVEETAWSKFKKRFVTGDLLPVEREEEIMLDHAYDGIHELNNHMPPWLKYFFFATIGFAAVYLTHYMVLKTGKLQIQEYEEELVMAQEEAKVRLANAKNSITEETAVLVTDAAALNAAKAFYDANCVACHKVDGGGGVGPNLTDEYWIHGGSVKDVFKVIKYGVKEKGMISWQDKLNPEQIQNMTSYILTFQGTTPADPKDPQGEKYTPANIPLPIDSTTVVADTTKVVAKL